MTQEAATREHRASDLRSQLAGIEKSLVGEVVFQHIRTGRRPVTIYAMEDGEPIPIPEYMLPSAFSKTLADGRWMFTDNPAEAPEYRWGEVKCFLHAESAERATGILEEIGLAGKDCPAGKLASIYAKRMHGQHRHSKEWEAYQEHLTDKKEADAVAEQKAQTGAMLALGEKAAGARGTEFLDMMESPAGGAVVSSLAAKAVESAKAPLPEAACDVEGCVGFEGTAAQVRGHKMGAHKEKTDA